MLKQKHGIVLSFVKYSESSLIVRIYTREAGLASFMAKGIRSKNSKTRLAFFEPLNIIDLIAFESRKSNILNIREVKVDHAWRSLPFDEIKRSIMFFIAEVLQKTLKEENENNQLFDWLETSLKWFDLSDLNPLNFHLAFLIQLSRFLGFYPKKDVGEGFLYFDLEAGIFTNSKPFSPAYISGDLTLILEKLLQSNYEDAANLKISGKQRRELLDMLIKFYQFHFPGFGSLKSLEILKMLLS